MRRLLFPLFWLIELPLAVAAALLLLIWLWSGSEGSLSTTLEQASGHLPAGHTLTVRDVRGSLRRGGHIGLLRWEKDGLSVQARNIDLAWQPMALLERRLQFDNVRVGELGIDDKSPSASIAPPEPLVWPLQVELPFVVDVLRWSGPPALQAGDLAGRYQFDGLGHALTLERAQFAAGRYQAQASVLARAPMTIELQVQGKVQAPLGKRSIALDASASLRGPLAGADAVLALEARLQPDPASTRPGAARPPEGARHRSAQPDGAPTSATLSAQLRPWAAQPIQRALASFTQLNLGALWPDAPQTLLTGTAKVQAQGPAWAAQISLVNRLPGPLDRQRLPVERAVAQLLFAGGNWNIQSLNADAAAGTLEAKGRLGDAALLGLLSGWQGELQLRGVNPALVHSRLAPARLDGALQARAQQQVLVFDALLQPAGKQPATSPLQGLRLQSAAAKGRWAAGWLQMQSLLVKTDDAQLQGQFDLQPATRTARGALQLALPGAQAQTRGQFAAQDGAGELTLQVSDATKAARWLAMLPQAPPALAHYEVQGRGELSMQWQGGWQNLIDGRGVEPSVRIDLQLPQLDLRATGKTAAQSLRLRDLRADASGRLSALSIKLGAELQSGSRLLTLRAQAQGGRTPGGGWQLALNPLRLQVQDQQRPGLWTLNLRQPLMLGWQAAGPDAALRASAAEAELTGPLPGTATLAWRPVVWGFGARSERSSQGELRGLSLAWLDWLSGTQLSGMGLSGDMLFDGSWDLAATDTLRLRAALVRRSGDIRMLADAGASASIGAPAAGAVIDAGIKEARITVSGDGDKLGATLRWDSERAGTASAEFSTRLTESPGGWVWALDAPLSATVRARLPQVGAWSVLAPPGWRMRGTLDANLLLSGSRLAPQWSGTLQADGLALRSVVDGFEFGNGRLRASMVGQRLFINEFSLQGAGGVAAGGELSARGSAVWLPDDNGANPGLARIRIDLEANARALRVSARADRRLALSGTLKAALVDARLDVQGDLKVDQALFVLPDENTPALGDDVVINRPIAGSTGAARGSTGTTGTDTRTRVATEVAIALDLGQDFRVRGRGLNTRIAGTVQLRSAAGATEAPRLTGEVRTVRGTYKAYGQLLDIEQGVMRFGGQYDNPALDILAIRPNLTERVGVQITGTVLSPRVRLYSEPEMADVEKLSWLVLGRSGADGGAESAVLQQAALALLGRNAEGLSGGLSNALGLDELSFSGGVGNTDGGARSATVTLGKRLSRDFYVAYRRSLEGTLGTFSIFYDISRGFTLRASTGEQNAIDLIFTFRYD